MAQQTQGIELGALTRTTPFVQSRSFNKCQKLQRSVCFSVVEGKFKCYDLTSLHSAVSENVPQKLPYRWNNSFGRAAYTNYQIKNIVFKDRLRMGVSCLKWFILLHNLLILHTLHFYIFCIFCLVCIVCIVCMVCMVCKPQFHFNVNIA